MTSASLLKLLTRPGCHLCEEASIILGRLGVVFATIDIEPDPALELRYGDAIPVLLHGDQEICRAPMTERSLKSALEGLGLKTRP